MVLTLTELLAQRSWLFWLALLLLAIGTYFGAVGWLTGYLALV